MNNLGGASMQCPSTQANGWSGIVYSPPFKSLHKHVRVDPGWFHSRTPLNSSLVKMERKEMKLTMAICLCRFQKLLVSFSSYTYINVLQRISVWKLVILLRLPTIPSLLIQCTPIVLQTLLEQCTLVIITWPFCNLLE